MAPVTAACVVVATAVEAPTATDNVCVGANHTSTPVAATCVVATGSGLITDTEPLTSTDPEIDTDPVLVTVTVIVPVTVAVAVTETLRTTVWDAASQTRPPVTPDACVVVVGTLLEPPETETVPEITTVLETLTVPLTAADTV